MPRFEEELRRLEPCCSRATPGSASYPPEEEAGHRLEILADASEDLRIADFDRFDGMVMVVHLSPVQ
jgi:hypothetical protein